MFTDMRIFFLLTAIIFSSCSILEEKNREVTFVIPELPETFPPVPIVRYKITVTNHTHEYFYLPPDKKSFDLSVPVAGVTSVLAYPVIKSSLLKPAGFIVSSNLDRTNHLTWEKGFAAEAVSLACSGGYTENLNTDLFGERIKENSGENPWALDRNKVVYALQYGIFNGNYLKKRAVRSLPLLGPEEKWHSDYPGRELVYSSESLPVMDGENLFIDSGGTASLWIFSDNVGWTAVYSDVRGGLSGNW